MTVVRAVLVPGVPALLPQYGGRVDPVADLRAACASAVADLAAGGPGCLAVVAASPLGLRVARHLLAAAGHDGAVSENLEPGTDLPAGTDAVLLVGNGSACRSEKAPGHLDPRAEAFDEALDRTVRRGEAPPADEALARELWCADLAVFRRLHAVVAGAPQVRYAGDPYGVAYWVATWPDLVITSDEVTR